MNGITYIRQSIWDLGISFVSDIDMCKSFWLLSCDSSAFLQEKHSKYFELVNYKVYKVKRQINCENNVEIISYGFIAQWQCNNEAEICWNRWPNERIITIQRIITIYGTISTIVCLFDLFTRLLLLVMLVVMNWFPCHFHKWNIYFFLSGFCV